MSTQVVSVNPLAEVRPGDIIRPKEKNQKSFYQRHGGKLKTLMVIGTVAAAGVAGYFVGTNQVPSAQVTQEPEGGDVVVNSKEQAKMVLHQAFDDSENLAITGGMTPDVLNAVLDEYEADMENWEDNYLTKEIMQSLKLLRDDFRAQQDKVRKLEEEGDGSLRANYRALTEQILGRENNELASQAWQKIENADYSNAIKDGDDYILIQRDSQQGKCYIIAQESGSIADWMNNLDVGSEDIMSMLKYNIRDKVCGCEKKTLWWCSRYRVCPAYKKIGQGHDGFIKVYNRQRLAVKSQVQARCSSSDTIVFAGYSRGAGIVTPLALAFSEEGIIPKSRMKLVTFGSPRVLGDSCSDKLHNDFTQLRLVYKKDPVPSLPYGWMGVKHVGSMYCNNCGYDQGRDSPGFSWAVDGGIGDHTSYQNWF